MNRRPVVIEINDTIRVNPEQVFESEVVKSGNGAVIKAFKRHIGKKAIVIIKDEAIKVKSEKELYDWMQEQKKLYHEKKLTKYQIDQLEKLPGWTWD